MQQNLDDTEILIRQSMNVPFQLSPQAERELFLAAEVILSERRMRVGSKKSKRTLRSNTLTTMIGKVVHLLKQLALEPGMIGATAFALGAFLLLQAGPGKHTRSLEFSELPEFSRNNNVGVLYEEMRIQERESEEKSVENIKETTSGGTDA